MIDVEEVDSILIVLEFFYISFLNEVEINLNLWHLHRLQGVNSSIFLQRKEIVVQETFETENTYQCCQWKKTKTEEFLDQKQVEIKNQTGGLWCRAWGDDE